MRWRGRGSDDDDIIVAHCCLIIVLQLLLLTLLDGPGKKPWQTIKLFDVYEDDVTNMVAATDINELLVLLIRRRGLVLELNVAMAIIQKEGRPINYLMIKVDKR